MTKEERLQKFNTEYPNYFNEYTKKINYKTPEYRKKHNIYYKKLYKKLHPNSNSKISKFDNLNKKERRNNINKVWWSNFIKTEKGKIFVINRNHNRRTKTKGSLNKYEWDNLKKKYKNKCLCCQLSEPIIKLTIDHITPISKGGLHLISNIQPLCINCNCKKYNKCIDFRPKI
jgi:hypothetical protein